MWKLISEAPGGAWFVSEACVFWRWPPDLVGITVFGRLDAAEVSAILSCFDDREAADCVLDLRRGGRNAGEILDPLIEGLVARGGVLAANVARQIVLRPDGLCGLALDGLPTLLPPEAPLRVCASPAEAAGWLARAEVLRALAFADARVDERTRVGTVVFRLRDLFFREGLHLSIAEAGRLLGMSSRGLQRHLERGGTGFRQERERARLDLARELLVETDLKLEIIARRIGFRSAAHFTVFFGKHAGLPPSRWRGRESRRCPPVAGEVASTHAAEN